MDLETYEAKIRCWNCGERIVLSIPKGTAIETYLESSIDRVCPNCGCSLYYEED